MHHREKIIFIFHEILVVFICSKPMKKINPIFIASASVLLPFVLFAMTGEEASLEEQWRIEISNGPKEEDKKLLLGKHVTFVEGVLGKELANIIGNYFTNNKKAVEKDFSGTTSIISPSCKLSIPENAKILNRKIKEIAYEQKKPQLLLGHSKGAAEIYYLLLNKPQLLLNGTIEQVLLVQAAIFGSPLADESGGLLFGLLNAFLDCNMDTLTTERTRAYFDKAFKEFDEKMEMEAKIRKMPKNELIKYISDRIFWVRTSLDESNPSLGSSLILLGLQNSLHKHQIEHDGLLPLSSQMDKRLGRCLGTLHNIDHIGLTVAVVSDVSDRAQRAFTRTAFKLMAQRGNF